MAVRPWSLPPALAESVPRGLGPATSQQPLGRIHATKPIATVLLLSHSAVVLFFCAPSSLLLHLWLCFLTLNRFISSALSEASRKPKMFLRSLVRICGFNRWIPPPPIYYSQDSSSLLALKLLTHYLRQGASWGLSSLKGHPHPRTQRVRHCYFNSLSNHNMYAEDFFINLRHAQAWATRTPETGGVWTWNHCRRAKIYANQNVAKNYSLME